MEELIRNQIHEALEVEPTPPSLRARIMDSLPAAGRSARQPAPSSMRITGQWSAGVVATLLAIAIIVGLLYSRGLLHSTTIPVRPPLAPRVGLISPEGVAVGADGSVYVSDFLGDRVFKLRPDGGVSVYAGGGNAGDGPALKASLFHPAGLALDQEGDLYIADTPGGTVRKVDTHGILSTYSGAAGTYAGPMGLAVDGQDVLWVSQLVGYVAHTQGGRGLVSGGQGASIDGSSLPPPTWVPGYMAFDPAGNLYISDRAPGLTANVLYSAPSGGGCRILRLNPDGKLKIIAGTGVCGLSGDGGPATSAQLNDPNGIAFDPAGNLYFADANNHRIRRIDRNGIITTVAGTGEQGFADGAADSAQLQFPFGMAMSPSGQLYFADMTCQCWNPTAPGRLRVLNLSSGVVTTVMTGSTPVQPSG